MSFDSTFMCIGRNVFTVSSIAGASTKARALDWQTCDWAREQKVDSWAWGPEFAELWVHQAEVWLCIGFIGTAIVGWIFDASHLLAYNISLASLTQTTLKQNKLWVPGSRACTKAGTEVLPEGKAKPACLRLEDVRRSLLEKLSPKSRSPDTAVPNAKLWFWSNNRCVAMVWKTVYAS